jgi:hypothetical protein
MTTYYSLDAGLWMTNAVVDFAGEFRLTGTELFEKYPFEHVLIVSTSTADQGDTRRHK